MKIVFDTNCLVKILLRKSNYRCLWDAFVNGRFELCFTTEMLQEYEEVLSRFYSIAFTRFVIDAIISAPNAHQITVYYKWNLITADPDDNKFVDCALNAGANFIVSNDKHFNILKDITFPKVNVIDIDSFKEAITAN
jgi:putative PIN family toxin of toxin-antitoxin system